ncbi:MAG TPA: DUF559 domain-containing protein, partial [Gemmatimonadales bacterium]|nr:DUF559 domain-containing protein [Gemmatimonadales bacterium]
MPRHRIGLALASGTIVRVARGRYALPSLTAARSLAMGASATASHTTAALHWGWQVKHEPDLPHITLPRGRKLRAAARTGVQRHWRDLETTEVVDGWVTSRERTVIDCCLDLPFDEALSVVDSALRGGLPRSALVTAARALGPRLRARALAVFMQGSAKAANPFESVLRAIALGVAGAGWDPQHRIRYDDFYARVDLADERLQLVLEADSFEFHGERAAMSRDAERYDELVSRGWLVLRFTWEQVMLRPAWVARVIERTVRRRLAELGSDEGRV